MQLWVRRVVALASALVLALGLASTAEAQGVTSASITGRVTQDGGQPLEGATVVVTNTSTGQRFQIVSRAGGRFALENLPPGGPYTVEVRAIGFQAGRRTGVRLELGQRYASDFSLKAAVVEVQEIVVQGVSDPLINRGRTGAATTISENAVSGLPTSSRNFTDLIVTSPAVVATPNGGPSIAGSNNRFNNIQIDGSVNNDLFGLGSSGAPGGSTSGRPIPLGAVKEFQVLVAPFDVRQGGFTGGLVNAVTKSGDNQYRGEAFVYRQNTDLVSEWPHPKPAEFSLWQFGGTVSGPIVRDRVHFFGSVEKQDRSTPYGGQLVADFDPTNGTAYCGRFVAAIAALGQSAGDCGGFTFTNPNLNVFGKVTAQAGRTGQVEFSLNYASSESQTLSRSATFDYNLTGGGYSQTNNNVTPRFKWTNIFNDRFNNELILAYSRIRDNRPPNTPFPTVIVDAGNYNLVSGAERFSQANSLNQDIWEFTDNLNFDVGAHRVTVGTHNEFFGFTNVFFPQSIGQWTFSSIDSLEAGLPTRFDRALPAASAGIAGGRADGPISDFEVRQYGLYAQDQFTPFKNFNLTVGIRADIPTFPLTPPTNPTFKTIFGIDTGEFPSGNTLWSPRLGFNYDPMGNGGTIVRGGAGVFSGRPPYVWLSNAYGNSGLEQAQLACSGATNVPIFGNFGLDPNTQPTTCRTGAGAGAPTPTINFFDPDFKFPQSLRINLGVDKRLPWGMVANVDLLYANNFKSLYLIDINLVNAWESGSSTLAGEGGRLVYGTKPATATGAITPLKSSTAFNNVIGHYNRGLDYSYSGVFQLQKRLADRVEFSAGYTYSRSYDMISQTSSIAFSNYGFATLDGPLGNRNLRTSVFDRPHKATFSTTAHLPYNIDMGLTYIGVSGSPYGYVINGDANGDGVGGRERNDMVYVPNGITDISFSTAVEASPALKQATFDSLNAYIDGESCLSGARGKLMERNTCRNPWANFVNLRLSWSTMTYRGQRFEISADVFNFLHLLNNEWGLVKETSSFEGATLLRRVGFDAPNDRNRYALSLPRREVIQTNASRTRLQIGARYTF